MTAAWRTAHIRQSDHRPKKRYPSRHVAEQAIQAWDAAHPGLWKQVIAYPCMWADDPGEGQTADEHWHVGRVTRAVPEWAGRIVSAADKVKRLPAGTVPWDWTEAELAVLADESLSASQVAALTGRSENAVRVKRKKLRG